MAELRRMRERERLGMRRVWTRVVAALLLALLWLVTMSILRANTMQLGSPRATADNEESRIALKHSEAAADQLNRHNAANETAYILAFDLWERAVNLRTAFLNLQYIAADTGTTLVEPFIANSKVSPRLLAPCDFTSRANVPQPLSVYFTTSRIRSAFGSLALYSEWSSRAQVSSGVPDSRDDSEISFIHALVTFDWPDDRSPAASYRRLRATMPNSIAFERPNTTEDDFAARSPALYWCDDLAPHVQASASWSSSLWAAFGALGIGEPTHGSLFRRSVFQRGPRVRELRRWTELRSIRGAQKLITKSVVYSRRLCVDGTRAPLLSPEESKSLLNAIFRSAAASTAGYGTPLEQGAVTVAFTNFRKHAFERYTNELKRSYGPVLDELLTIGDVPSRLARLELERSFRNARNSFPSDAQTDLIALHFRAGGVMARTQSARNRGALFARWSAWCMNRLLNETRDALTDLSATTAVPPSIYLASDIFNDGMRGGERPLYFESHNALQYARERFQTRSNQLSHRPMMRLDVRRLLNAVQSDRRSLKFTNRLDLEAAAFLRQDQMGLASMTDMAVCLHAPHFITMQDSFSRFVAKQRSFLNKSTTVVSCALAELT